ncbi:MAG: hypothetical protein M3Z05_21960 [Gemmatimonadota bacterium]|nr:hypothetical protein [Gemmatimonadota bacterium]
MTPDSASGYVGDNVTFAARAFSASGTEIVGRTVTWASLDAGVATVSNGNVVFVAPGTARITATVDAQSATAMVISNRPPLARVVLTPAALLLGIGQITTLTAVATDRAGATMSGQAFTFTSTNSAVAAVSSSGVVTPGVTGSTAIIATATGPTGTFADTSLVTVGGSARLAIALPDTVIGPNQTLKITGAGLAGATAKVGGIAVALSNVTAVSAELVIPASLFQPCLRAGITYPVSLKVGADSLVGQLAAQAVPVQISLAPGQHVIVQSGLDLGCPIATSSGGTYVLMPYTWDKSYKGVSVPAFSGPRPSVAVAVGVINSPLTSAALASVSRNVLALPSSAIRDAVRHATLTRFMTSGAHGILASFIEGSPAAAFPTRASASRSTGSRALLSQSASPLCGPAMAYGATASRWTHREVNGWADNHNRLTDPVEPWYVASVSNELAVVVDSIMWRKMSTDASIKTRLDQLTAQYDTTVAPLYTRYSGHAISDNDGNGHVIVLMPFWGSTLRNGSSPETNFASGGGFTDCPAGTSNEAIFLTSVEGVLSDPADSRYTPPNVGNAVSLLSHEATHALDFSARPVGTSEASWATEGVAELVRFLWTNGANANSLKGNLPFPAARALGSATASSNGCLSPDLTALIGFTSVDNLYYPNQDYRAYNLGCHFLRYTLEQADLAGITNEAALTRFFAQADRSSTQVIYNGMLGTSKSARDVFGEFLMSWAADEVPGASAVVQDRSYQLKNAWTGLSAGDVWSIPEKTITPGTAVVTTLYEPSVHYYQVVTSGAIWVTYAAPNGAPVPVDRTSIGILRVK